MIKIRSMSCSPRLDYVEIALEIPGDRALVLWRVHPTDRPGLFRHQLHHHGELIAEADTTGRAATYFCGALRIDRESWPAFDVLCHAVDGLLAIRFSDIRQHVLEAEYKRGYEDGWRAYLDADKGRRDSARTFLYLAQRDQYLKIGVSGNAEKRVSSLSTALGEPVLLVATRRFPSREQALTAERKAHEKFAAHRLLGEWFHDVPEIRAHFAGRKR